MLSLNSASSKILDYINNIYFQKYKYKDIDRKK
jgi:hypothetical protein